MLWWCLGGMAAAAGGAAALALLVWAVPYIGTKDGSASQDRTGLKRDTVAVLPSTVTTPAPPATGSKRAVDRSPGAIPPAQDAEHRVLAEPATTSGLPMAGSANPAATSPAAMPLTSADPLGTTSTRAPGAEPSEPGLIKLRDAVARGSITPADNAPTGCLADALRTVLSDVATRFGPVTIVSTTHLHTNNHGSGSTREKLHAACKAVDLKVQSRGGEVVAYLRSRPEVGGINTYRNNGVIHIDLNENHVVAHAGRR